MSSAPTIPVARTVAGRGAGSYWQVSREPRYSLLFALPLLLLYEALAAALNEYGNAGIRNGADVIVKALFAAVAGQYGPIAFAVCLIGGSIWLIGRDMRRNRGALRPRYFGLMLGESALLALVFGLVVGTITARLLGSLGVLALAQTDTMSLPVKLMVSLGAGLYEELLFRVVLVSSLIWLATRFFGWKRGSAAAFAVVLGALIFSAFHYIGAYGDPFRLDSFVFRAIGGLAFSALYVTRGFGITAWTHALYDVYVLAL